MDILISGSSGLVGTALVSELERRGHRVTRLVRQRSADPSTVLWDPQAGTIALPPSARFDAVVHLSGENIASGRWSAARKQRILASRVGTTTLLVEHLSSHVPPPKVFLSASAIGIYGDGGSAVLTESSPDGTGFLAEVCRQWEAAARPIAALGTRLAHARLGVVLSKDGGALSKMLLPFRLGLGGRVGTGRQFFSWITLRDTVEALVFIVEKDELDGPVNVTSPNPVTNEELTRALAETLHRPAVIPVPAFALRAVFGEMADQTILCSLRVRPEKLLAAGFPFRDAELKSALKSVL